MTRAITSIPHKVGVLARLFRLGPLFAIVMSCIATNGYSESMFSREYQIRAAFLFNFAKFTRWPTDASSHADTPLSFCVMGVTPLSLALVQFIAGKRIRGRQATMRRVTNSDEFIDCNVLFIARTEQDAVIRFAHILSDSSVLTVGEIPHFAQKGGVIELLVVENKLRFAINVKAAKRARLKLSSHLLKLAQIVSEGTED